MPVSQGSIVRMSLIRRIRRRLKDLRYKLEALFGFPLLRRFPLAGDINDVFFADDAEIDDPKIGKSMSVPTVLEIVVDREAGITPAGVGEVVHKTFFPDRDKLIFNVCFSCGAANPFRPGVYGDPTSIWFNVFFGYYEIDVPKATWGRPFGYTADGQINWDDILRIGKADWNYFSNYVYGVPHKYIRPYDGLDDPQVKSRYLGREKVGKREWDLLELDGAQVVSAYVSGTDGKKLIDEDLVFSPLWRASFGQPSPRPEQFPDSFFPVRMKARIYMAWREVEKDNDLLEPAYQTFLFGGTINDLYPDKAENERFLGLQMDAVRKVMRGSYRDLGFDPEEDRPRAANE